MINFLMKVFNMKKRKKDLKIRLLANSNAIKIAR